MTESFHETDFLFFFKYMASLFCRLKFKQRYYRIMFSNLVKVRLSSLSGFQHTICKTFGIFSDYSLVIRAKGLRGSKMQKDPPRVKNANGSAEGRKGKRVGRESSHQKRSKGQQGTPRVKRAKGSAEGALQLPLVDFPTTLQKMPRVSPGPADIPYSCIRARSSIGSPEQILQQGKRKVLDVLPEDKKCEIL